MGFNSFIGNAKTVEVVQDILASRRIPHAFLFSGPDGVGKKTLAIMFAKALNCQRKRDDFCGDCTRCRKAEEMLDVASRDLTARRDLKDPARRAEGFVYFDLQVIEPLTRFILIEQIRQLRNVAYTLPFELPCRVFIIDQAQAIHWQAVDLLLKLLEEPPETTTLILICPNYFELRPTIRSRCRLIRFVPVEESIIVRVLAKDGRVPQNQWPLVARLAAGSIARAKGFDLQDFQHRRRPWLGYLSSLVEGAATLGRVSNYELLFDSTKALTEDRDQFRETLRIGYSLLSDLMRILVGQSDSEVTNIDIVGRLKEWAPKFQLHGIESLKNGLDKAYRLYARNVNLQLCLDALAAEFHSLMGAGDSGW